MLVDQSPSMWPRWYGGDQQQDRDIINADLAKLFGIAAARTGLHLEHRQ